MGARIDKIGSTHKTQVQTRKCKERLPHLYHEATTYEMDPGLQVHEYLDHCPSG